MVRFKEREKIGTVGDSFCIVFAKPSEAMQFALLLQNGRRALARRAARPLPDRVRIDIGDGLEMEYVAGRDLKMWGEELGGVGLSTFKIRPNPLFAATSAITTTEMGDSIALCSP